MGFLPLLLLRVVYIHHTCVLRFTASVDQKTISAALVNMAVTKNTVHAWHTATAQTKTFVAIHPQTAGEEEGVEAEDAEEDDLEDESIEDEDVDDNLEGLRMSSVVFLVPITRMMSRI